VSIRKFTGCGILRLKAWVKGVFALAGGARKRKNTLKKAA